jgi:hypothetical protein
MNRANVSSLVVKSAPANSINYGNATARERSYGWFRPGVLTIALASAAFAQAPAPAPEQPRSGKQAALADFTGYWAALVTEDWRFRMITPAKGDVTGVPVTPEARKVVDAWDPAKDEAAGESCKSYGAPGLMRRPTRLHITWQDDNTLKVETDEGTQTRLFHFNAEAPGNQYPTLQGYSVATWQGVLPQGGGGGRGGGGGGGRAGRGGPPAPVGPGSIKVVTTKLKSGYLRANGLPYSENTVLTEYFTRVSGPEGQTYLVLTSAVEDPLYLRGDFLTSTHYLKEADGSKWDPSPCHAK